MSIRPQLIDTLILHGAVRALEARGFRIKPGADEATSIGHSATGPRLHTPIAVGPIR
jgi:hypothetical protein